MSILKTGKRATLTRTVASAALALAAVGGMGTASFAAGTVTQTVMTPSSGTGPTNGGATITLTLPTTATTKFSSGFVGVQFQPTTSTAAATATCSTNPSTAVQAAGQATVGTDKLRFLSSTKISITTPDVSALTGGPTYFLICAYNAPADNVQASVTNISSTSATVLGKANFIVAAAPTIAASNANPITPATGPAAGGQTVTIKGTGFPTAITTATPLSATLGGLALTSITPISATGFTAVTPARIASSTAQVLTVTTAGGTATSKTAGSVVTGIYTYVNGVDVSPNTVASGQSVDVDVTGSGFNSLVFDATSTAADIVTATAANAATHTNSTSAHVYLVQPNQTDTSYSATGYPGGTTTNKANGQQTECVDPVVISDAELICTINTAKKVSGAAGVYQYVTGPLKNGTYEVVVVSDGNAAAPAYQTALSSGAAFTVADF